MEFIYELSQVYTIAKKILSFTDEKIFFFDGNLGTGKTTLIKECVKQLDSDDAINSPSYSIINQYNSRKGLIFHMDLYRVKSYEELLDFGIEEYLYSGNYCFIEWTKFLEDWFEESRVSIQINHNGSNRKIRISF